MHVTKLSIKNLRGVKDGVLDGLSPLSILVGPNNCGKSTCLEAIATIGNWASASSTVRLLLRRGGPALHALSLLMLDGQHGFEISAGVSSASGSGTLNSAMSISSARDADRLQLALREGLKEPIRQVSLRYHSISASDQWNGQTQSLVDAGRKVTTDFILGISSPSPISMCFVDVETVRLGGALEDAYSTLENKRKIESTVRALKRSMPDLTDLRILKVGDEFVLHAIVGGGTPMPVYVAGDGFKRLLEIAANVCSVKDGVVLIEEPECFQHPRYLKELVAILRDSVASGNQVILSTHSIELIDQLLQPTAGSSSDWPTVHRLRLTDNVLRSTTLSAEQALSAREDLMEDLRA